MKKSFLAVFISLFLLNANAQESTDEAFKVIYINKEHKDKPAFFVNGQFYAYSALNPDSIQSIDVKKGDTVINGTNYSGQIYITLKSNGAVKEYEPRLVSLSSLKTKYAGQQNLPVLFSIDGNFVTEDYDLFKIDEQHILQMEIENINNDKQQLHFVSIRVLLKSEENINKLKNIRIRGGVALR